MQISLSGKIAVVTGAASGVGLATVHQFVESGIEHLIVVDCATELPGSLKNLLESSPDRIQFLRGDVKDRSTHEQYAELAVRRFGGVDVLVNNAGVSVVKPIHEHTEQEWDYVMDTNVKALYWSARAILPSMMQRRSGVILNTGSISGHVGILKQGAYGP